MMTTRRTIGERWDVAAASATLLNAFLDEAADSLTAANVLRANVVYHRSVLMAHHAAECALKALYLARPPTTHGHLAKFTHEELGAFTYREIGGEFRAIHDLTRLVRMALFEASPSESLIAPIDEFQQRKPEITSRYPDLKTGKRPALKWNEADADKAIKLASDVLSWVSDRVSPT